MRQTYLVKTFGCQMNKHDAERVSGLLAEQGLTPVAEAADADVIVVLTCAVREGAEERLRGQVASLKALKRPGGEGPTIAVGGCIAQRDGERLLEALPHVDVVFGTNNISSLPRLLDLSAPKRPAIEVLDRSSEFASDLPSVREHDFHAWLPITVGCDNFCTYCIVPYVRGAERSRPIEDVVAEAASLVADGVKEITLLGQNVNSYGRDLTGTPHFAEVLRRVAATGIERLGFATSHPKDLSVETLEAMVELDAVLDHLHLPVQSGSDQILSAMNRTYTAAEYCALVDRVYERMPNITLSTDIIVGFPGETDEDFAATAQLATDVRFDQAFTFIYSPREGTPAASMEPTVTREVAQGRIDRLVSIVQASAHAKNLALVGTVQSVLVEGPSKRDPSMLTGKTRGAKIVHFPAIVNGVQAGAPGETVSIRINEAHTWYLLGTSALG